MPKDLALVARNGQRRPSLTLDGKHCKRKRKLPKIGQKEKILKFSQFWSDNGRIVVYFHGVLGAPEECAIFDVQGKENGLTIICFDRFAIDASIFGEAYYQLLAREITKHACGAKVDVIGFSIGAFIALQTCRYLPEGIRNLHLISAAAPLEAGNFLDEMAGKPVFRLAKTFPAFFVLFSYWQGWLALLLPKLLFRLLFARATGEDKFLAADHEFQRNITQVLRTSLNEHVTGYTRDIKAYVDPWETTLSEISVNARIWHGELDNWSPVGMAKYLQSALPRGTDLEILDGLSHYSCLYATAPRICKGGFKFEVQRVDYAVVTAP